MSENSEPLSPLQLFCCQPDSGLGRRKSKLKKELTAQGRLIEKRIAILGGSTTSELAAILELYLLNSGIAPKFYQSGFNRYYEEIMFGSAELDAFKPDVIYLHTTVRNLVSRPAIKSTRQEIDGLLSQTMQMYSTLWDTIGGKYGCLVIQNNFDPPPHRSLGNLDGVDPRGLTHFVRELNQRFAREADQRPALVIQDIDRLAAETGLDNWHDPSSWFAYKCSPGLSAIPRLAQNLAGLLRAIFGKASKCLVLDLDNTLWGGVIGDDGVEGIRLGRETAEASAFLAFQEYVKSLKDRGVILAVCSKNEEDNARAGLKHPDSALSLDDFTLIRANWSPKSDNLAAIAADINIGVDSLVMFDDNPAEREIVLAQLPDVAVIEPGGPTGSDVSTYITALDRSGLFETINLSAEDIERSRYYQENAKRNTVQFAYSDYGDYLDSLEMVAEISSFVPEYYDRITQLTNKTNQFNLTTRRYTLPEIQKAAVSDEHLCLYGRLSDKFGDNGLISVLMGRIEGLAVTIDLWLMSCRVFKREMELAMFDALVAAARKRNIKQIFGSYIPTQKNVIVASFYEELGFQLVSRDINGDSIWRFDLTDGYTPKNEHIRVQHG
ncbi:MAG: HAD-IIIC family phosphatase [Desulfovibrio sp.]